MKYVIFLDVDGVLNCDTTKDTVDGFTGIDDTLVVNLSDLCKRFEEPVSIVLTTTWAEYWYRDPRDKELQDSFATALDNHLRRFGLHAIDKILRCTDYCRGAQISRYLGNHPEIEGYVILDDFDFDFMHFPEIASHWIQTAEAQGFHAGLVDFAERVLRGEAEVEHGLSL